MVVRLFIFLFVLCVGVFSTQSYADSSNNSQTSFLVLTDIHFDPFTACYDKATQPCPMIKKLQAAPASEWPAILAEEDTKAPVYREDTNNTLLTSSLLAAKQAASAQHARFVLVLGDFVGHDFRLYYKKYAQDKSHAGYQAFVRKLLVFLTNELANTFPSLDVYPLIGNNDAYRGDYYSDPNGQFYQETGALWSQLIKNNSNRNVMQREFKTAGYYAVDVPTQNNMRLIMMNTVLFSTKARGKNIAKASRDEMDWLHDELALAKLKNQKVIIGIHIPEGIDVYSSLRVKLFRLIDFWQPEDTQRFQEELQQFAPQISGIYAGHLHADWFEVQRFDHFIEIPILGTPSISPIFGNNPGFKIYSYSTQTGTLDDFTTYYLPLNGQQKLFLPNCQACRFTTGSNSKEPTSALANFYKLFYTLNTPSQPITMQWTPYYQCAVHEVKLRDDRKCIV